MVLFLVPKWARADSTLGAILVALLLGYLDRLRFWKTVPDPPKKAQSAITDTHSHSFTLCQGLNNLLLGNIANQARILLSSQLALPQVQFTIHFNECLPVSLRLNAEKKP